MVRDVTKAMVSFTWAMSVFGMQQLANAMLLDQKKVTEDSDVATQALAANLGQLPSAVFLLGDSMQRELLRNTFSLLEPSAWNQNSDAVKDLIEQTSETFRGLNPFQSGSLTVPELQNKTEVFRLVLQIPGRLDLPDKPPYPVLTDVVAKAYDMEDYPALWAVEGLGHWYGDTFYKQEQIPHGILQGGRLSGLPEKSLTMLNAGIGMAIAQHWMKTINHYSDPSDVRHALRQVVSLCRDNATPGYEGAALESLGLITQNGQFYDEARPDEMVQIVGRELLEINAPDAFEYFWHGVGRSHYFLPINFLPGYGSIWHAVDMIEKATAHDSTARLNAISGLAWGVTMVNIRNPEILANVLKYHGDELATDNAFANGVASGLIMRQDTTPNASFISALYGYEPDASDADLVRHWNEQIQQPCQQVLAAGGYYQKLRDEHRLGQIFRYNAAFQTI